MMKTSRPRTFSSILTNSSPSAKWRIDTAHSGCPKWPAISSASGRLAVPASSNNWLRETVRSAMGPPKIAVTLREAKVLPRLRLESLQGGRELIHLPRVQPVHRAAAPASHPEAACGRVECQRQENAPARSPQRHPALGPVAPEGVGLTCSAESGRAPTPEPLEQLRHR